MKTFHDLLLGAVARRALRLAIAAGILAPVVAHASDAMPMMATMDHGSVMSDSAPPPPATLTWAMMAPAGEFMLNYNPTSGDGGQLHRRQKGFRRHHRHDRSFWHDA